MSNKDARRCKAISNFAMQATAIFLLVTILIVVLISTIKASVAQPATFRMCGISYAADVGVAPGGETGAIVPWTVTGDLNADMITFDIRVLATMSAVRAIEIRGPLQLGLNTGPLAAVLCGQSSIVQTIEALPSCNTFESPGHIRGFVSRVWTGATAEGFPVRDLIQAIRDDPKLYYAEVMTNVRPNSPGAVRFSLASYCGYP